MKKQNLSTALAAAIAMLVLILDSKTALSGATAGIDLCLRILIPSLFPFFVLSVLMTSALYGQALPLLNPVASVCKIPAGVSSLFAVGLLGGYPAGARNVAAMYHSGQLSKAQASRMIVFCNNAGPAFIFGILQPMFSNPMIPWILWGVHILSAIAVGVALPAVPDQNPSMPAHRQIHLTDALQGSLRAMSQVCGWVVMTRMILAFLDRWFLALLPVSMQVALTGFLELSNGCIRLTLIESEALRFLLSAGMLALGGICVALQTSSVTAGIPMHYYFPGKLLQCCVSVLFAGLLCPVIFPSFRFGWIPYAAFSGAGIAGCLLSLRNCKNTSRIPAVLGV